MDENVADLKARRWNGWMMPFGRYRVCALLLISVAVALAACAELPQEPKPAASEAGKSAPADEPNGGATAGALTDLAGRQPYVVIRFSESSVDYEAALAAAVKRAIERKSNVAFDLVAVTPRASTAEELAELAQEANVQAAAVKKSLADLGIGPDRVRIMTWTGQSTDVNEIRLYIR